MTPAQGLHGEAPAPGLESWMGALAPSPGRRSARPAGARSSLHPQGADKGLVGMLESGRAPLVRDRSSPHCVTPTPPAPARPWVLGHLF